MTKLEAFADELCKNASLNEMLNKAIAKLDEISKKDQEAAKRVKKIRAQQNLIKVHAPRINPFNL